jgi:metallo-beta-lactamase family protein
LFVGYQGRGTLGRQILEGKEVVRIHGQDYKVRANIAQIFGFSGHADRGDLLDWVDAFEQPAKKIFLTHGEEEPALALAKQIQARGWDVDVPKFLDVVELI